MSYHIHLIPDPATGFGDGPTKGSQLDHPPPPSLDPAPARRPARLRSRGHRARPPRARRPRHPRRPRALPEGPPARRRPLRAGRLARRRDPARGAGHGRAVRCAPQHPRRPGFRGGRGRRGPLRVQRAHHVAGPGAAAGDVRHHGGHDRLLHHQPQGLLRFVPHVLRRRRRRAGAAGRGLLGLGGAGPRARRRRRALPHPSRGRPPRAHRHQRGSRDPRHPPHRPARGAVPRRRPGAGRHGGALPRGPADPAPGARHRSRGRLHRLARRLRRRRALQRRRLHRPRGARVAGAHLRAGRAVARPAWWWPRASRC